MSGEMTSGTTEHWRGRYLAMHERNGWEYISRHSMRGIVMVIAVTDDDEVVLVEQHRPPLNAPVIELPAGLVGDDADHADEDELVAAQRELLEETGFIAARWTRITAGTTSPGLSDETVTLYRAEGLTRQHAGGGAGSERITVHVVPRDRLRAWIDQRCATGALVDLKVFLALGFE